MGELISGAWSPWRYLRRHHGDVRVYEAELPGDLLGCVDLGKRVIWLDSRLTDAERRSTLAHEIGHLERDLPCDHGVDQANAATERAIDEWAAAKLIPAEALARAVQWSPFAAEMAEELWVDEHMVRVRFRCLTDAEQDLIFAAHSRARGFTAVA